jgi:hypothetical protein
VFPDRKEQTRSNPASPKPAPRPPVGEPFNPCRHVCGFYPPDIVARQPGLTDGEKRLYDRGVRWAGRNGVFWYSYEKMATELGKSPRQVKRDLAELEKHRLIIHKRRGKCQSNIYRFLYHSMFDGEVTSTSHHPGGEGPNSSDDGTSDGPGDVTGVTNDGEVTSMSHHPGGEVPYSLGEVTSTSLGDVTPATHELYKKNFIKKSSSEDPGTRADLVTNQPIDDDHSFKEGKENSAVQDLVGSGLERGAADPLLGTAPLPRWFLEIAAKKIHASKCSGCLGGVDLGLYAAPDLAFTAKIVEPWRGKGTLALMDWLCSTVERQLGQKGKTMGPFVYGLFLSDSKACAQNWVPDQPLSRAAQLHIADEKRKAEEREAEVRHQKLMQTTVSVREAASILTARTTLGQGMIARWSLEHPRFIWLMEQRTRQISPADLSRAASMWRPCRKCHAEGITGSPLKRTLAFCECDIGRQELAARGNSYIPTEIGRVNASIRSKILQACRELRLDFTGDAVERAENKVIERDGVVEICLANDWEICCNEQDLKQALEYLGDRRAARVVRAGKLTPPHPGNLPQKPASPPTMAITQDDVDRVFAECLRQAPAPKEPAKAASLDGQSGGSAASLQRKNLTG